MPVPANPRHREGADMTQASVPRTASGGRSYPLADQGPQHRGMQLQPRLQLSVHRISRQGQLRGDDRRRGARRAPSATSSLAGVRYVIAFMYPKAIHQGNGQVADIHRRSGDPGTGRGDRHDPLRPGGRDAVRGAGGDGRRRWTARCSRRSR